MARKKRKIDSGETSADWIVTFSDCMTLLLCFFVMLVTFSSFDEVELQKLAGVFDYNEEKPSVFPSRKATKDSYVARQSLQVDLTDKGSETPTEEQRRLIKFPKQRAAILSDDAFRDQKVICIPAERLFYGAGTVMTADGRQYLAQIGGFLKVLPSRVIIGENGPQGEASADEELRLERARAVMDFFVSQGLSAESFSITAAVTRIPSRLEGQRIVALTLLSGKAF